MIAAPPLEAGAEKATVVCPFPIDALTAIGALGTVFGVTLLDAGDAGLVPAALVAATVNVYAVPLASPGTTIGEVIPPDVMPPGDALTV